MTYTSSPRSPCSKITSPAATLHEARSAGVGAVLRHEVDDPVGDGHEAVVVGRDDDDAAVGAQVAQERDDPLGLDVVEVGGGLVGQQDRRVGRQPAGDRDALLLAAGELVGPLARALGQADPLRGARRPGRIAVLAADPGQEQRDGDVLAGRERRDEVEGLEHEADRALAIRRLSAAPLSVST